MSMQVLVTLDRYDGSSSQLRECDIEEFPTREMMWKLMESDVCGYTVTKVVRLSKLMEKMEVKSEVVGVALDSVGHPW